MSLKIENSRRVANSRPVCVGLYCRSQNSYFPVESLIPWNLRNYCWKLSITIVITKLISIGKSSNIWIIMEYCPNGSLRAFLRNSRTRYSVEEESFDPDLSQVFGPKNLIYFAWQITKGMTFLTSRKVKFPPSQCQTITRSCTHTIIMYQF